RASSLVTSGRPRGPARRTSSPRSRRALGPRSPRWGQPLASSPAQRARLPVRSTISPGSSTTPRTSMASPTCTLRRASRQRPARVYAAAASGDARAVAILARAEAALGNLAITLVNGLNPSLIVIGGSIAEHEPAHTLEPMRRAIDTRAFRVAADAVRLRPPGL